jgi:hypothetical protein
MAIDKESLEVSMNEPEPGTWRVTRHDVNQLRAAIKRVKGTSLHVYASPLFGVHEMVITGAKMEKGLLYGLRPAIVESGKNGTVQPEVWRRITLNWDVR